MPTITFVKEKKELQVPIGANLRREISDCGRAVAAKAAHDGVVSKATGHAASYRASVPAFGTIGS